MLRLFQFALPIFKPTMSAASPIRILLSIAFAILLLLLLMVGIMLTDTLLNIRHHLQQAPDWVSYLVGSGFAVFSLLSGWLLLRLLRPKNRRVKANTEQPVLDEQALQDKIQSLKSEDINVSAAEQELQQLAERRAAGTIHIALYGEISSGKSSLIRALLPQAEAEVSVKGGTTQTLQQYHWLSPAGDELIVTDMPGLNEAGADENEAVRAEAMRAHLVIYLCDGDLTRSQMDEIRQLQRLNKPLIVALNKTDRLSDQEVEMLTVQIQQRLASLKQQGTVDIAVAAISSGGTRQVVRVLPDGTEQISQRPMPTRIDALKKAIQRALDNNVQVLEQLRDSAVFSLIDQQLETARLAQRDQEAQQLVRNYAKKAVVVAVATITPGSDILIQGYLATQMVKELSALYDVPVRKVDTELLLSLVQKHVRTHVTLLLAVAGNALKAFPGAGTLGGGVLHAIAYGFLFENLGKSLALSLRTRGELHPLQVAQSFEESLGENVKATAGFYTRLALKELRKKD